MWMKRTGYARAVNGRRNTRTWSALLVSTLTIAACCGLQPAWGSRIIISVDGGDTQPGGIFEYDLSGNQLPKTFDLSVFTYPNDAPRFYDVEIGPDGNVYACAFPLSSVYVWDYATGDYAGKPGSVGIAQPLFMQFRPNGNLLVSGEQAGLHGVTELQNDGASHPWTDMGNFSKDLTQTPVGGHYRAVALGPDGNYYVSKHGGEIERYFSDGSRDTSYSILTGIAFTGDIEFVGDDLLIANAGHGGGIIKRFDRETGTPGTNILPGGSALGYAEDMLLLPDGRLLVANISTASGNPGSVLEFDPVSGAYLGVFVSFPPGDFPRGLALVPAVLAAPSVVAIEIDTNEMIGVTFDSVTGQSYDVQLESDLVGGTWPNDPSNENIAGTGSNITVTVNPTADTQGIRVSTEF